MARKERKDRTNKIVLRPPGGDKVGGPKLLILVFPEIADRVVKAVQDGMPLKLACRQGRISEQTLHNYINAGEEVTERRDAAFAEGHSIDLNPSEIAVLTFFERIRHAQSEANAREVTFISIAAKKDWKAAAWLLGNKNPAAFPRSMTGNQQQGASATVQTQNPDGTKQEVTFTWHDGRPDVDPDDGE